jgi:cation diffusion facilitator family transporter
VTAIASPSQVERGARTALASIIAACVLVALKLGTGLATGSLALVSAGVESSGDVIAAVLTLVAVRLGARPADPEHPYGHRRAENLAALGESVIIAAAAALVTSEAIRRLAESNPHVVETSWWLFAVIGAAIVIDIGRIAASHRAARVYNSPAFRSNVINFGSDLAGSVAVLIGLLLVRAGYDHGDALAALVVGILIFGAVVRLVRENARVLMDRTPEDARTSAREALEALEPEVELRRLRLRESGGRYFADVVVAVTPGAAVAAGHAVADNVEDAIQSVLPASDVVVHVEPRSRGLDLRDRVLAAAMTEPQVSEAHDIQVFPSGNRATVSLHLKFADGLGLDEAHAVSERVEAAIIVEPDVEAVETHLEPLERPVPQRRASAAELASREAPLRALVTQRLGEPPRELRVVATDSGPVLFLTIAVAADLSLTDAHAVASELEEALRAQQGDLAEVVVHTEPA